MHPTDAISPGTFLAVVAVAAVSGTLAAGLARRGLALPVVVIELLLGVLIGPQVIGLHVTSVLSLFSDLGLAMLFFCAGFEIDFGRIAGQPLRLGALGWGCSLLLAYALTGILHVAGLALPVVYTGSAIATTAIGTLIPILSDARQLDTRFGTYLLAAGATGEFGPILLMTLLLSTEGTLHQTLILLAFAVVTLAIGWVAVRSSGRTLPLFHQTLRSSSQLAIRWLLVLVFALALLAYKLGLDLLLGGFAAGVIASQMFGEIESPEFDTKLLAVAYGVFVPFFFVTSGMELDVTSLFASVAAVVRLVVFFLLLLIVRGAPTLILYRRLLPPGQRNALALMLATQLPLVLAITTLAVGAHRMSAAFAATLVGAAVLSTLVFPLLGLRVLDRAAGETGADSVQTVVSDDQ